MTPTASAPDPAAAGLPHVFVDRSLGAIGVPGLLRAAGVQLTTMREHYGEMRGQQLADPPWIELVAERGWIGFHKDDAIRRNVLERRAVLASGARLFCITNANLTAAQAAERYLTNLDAIAAAAAEAGPYVFSVRVDHIEKMDLHA